MCRVSNLTFLILVHHNNNFASISIQQLKLFLRWEPYRNVSHYIDLSGFFCFLFFGVLSRWSKWNLNQHSETTNTYSCPFPFEHTVWFCPCYNVHCLVPCLFVKRDHWERLRGSLPKVSLLSSLKEALLNRIKSLG